MTFGIEGKHYKIVSLNLRIESNVWNCSSDEQLEVLLTRTEKVIVNRKKNWWERIFDWSNLE